MIDGTARVSASAKIGAGARIWQFASVIRGAVIGPDCTVGSCAIVDSARVGARCCIGHGAQLHPGTVIGDDVFVGPGAICCNDRWPRVDKDGFDAEGLLAGYVTVRVENGASIGAGVIILPGVTIGSGAMIAAGATVSSPVPAGFLLKRDGSLRPIEKRRTDRRMRKAA